MTKIKWFKEVLELEPGSKVFFPLARLYFDDGNYGEAMATLRHGLERNADHIEARFMLVEILSRLDRQEEAAAEVGTITGMLSRYPAFWKIWAETSAPSSKDSAMALSFLAANFQGASISWSQVMEKGLDALFMNGGTAATAAEDADEAPKPAAPGKSKKKAAKKAAPMEPDPTIRTRTMADLLAEQGDYEGALGIYKELAGQAEEPEAAELEALIEKMRIKLKRGPGKSAEPQPAEPEPAEAQPAEDVQAEPPVVEEVVEADGGDMVIDGEVAVAPEPGFDVDESGESGFEPSGGAQPVDVPDIEDEEVGTFDAQAVLDEMLGAGDDGDTGMDSFEADIAAAQEPDFDELADIDVDALLSDDEIEDLGDIGEAETGAEESEAEATGDADIAAQDGTKEPETLEQAVSAMPGKDNLMKTLEALADRLEARAAT